MSFHIVNDDGTLGCPDQGIQTSIDEAGTCSGCGHRVVSRCGAKNELVAAVCTKPEGHDLWHLDHIQTVAWAAGP